MGWGSGYILEEEKRRNKNNTKNRSRTSPSVHLKITLVFHGDYWEENVTWLGCFLLELSFDSWGTAPLTPFTKIGYLLAGADVPKEEKTFSVNCFWLIFGVYCWKEVEYTKVLRLSHDGAPTLGC